MILIGLVSSTFFEKLFLLLTKLLEKIKKIFVTELVFFQFN